MRGEGSGSRLPETGSSSLGWVDLAVVPLVAVLSVPTLLWFGDQTWAVLGKDAPRYLFAASELVEKAVALAAMFDREPATPDEARETFGLKGRAAVAF